MSVLIEGMEIPKEFDPDVYIELACGVDGNRYARLYNFHHGGLTEWCEIVSVPPHGRLVDADALLSSDLGGEPFKSVIRRVLIQAPTVIEAEETE